MIERILYGFGSVWYVVVVFWILVYGYIGTFGSELGSDKICKIVDESYDFMKWFVWLIFISGCFVGWKDTMLIGVWSIIVKLGRVYKSL